MLIQELELNCSSGGDLGSSEVSLVWAAFIWFMLLMPVMCKGRGGDMLSWLAVPMMCVSDSSDYYCPLVAGDHSSGSTIR